MDDESRASKSAGTRPRRSQKKKLWSQKKNQHAEKKKLKIKKKKKKKNGKYDEVKIFFFSLQTQMIFKKMCLKSSSKNILLGRKYFYQHYM